MWKQKLINRGNTVVPPSGKRPMVRFPDMEQVMAVCIIGPLVVLYWAIMVWLTKSVLRAAGVL